MLYGPLVAVDLGQVREETEGNSMRCYLGEILLGGGVQAVSQGSLDVLRVTGLYTVAIAYTVFPGDG
jgi:hypothetical protein